MQNNIEKEIIKLIESNINTLPLMYQDLNEENIKFNEDGAMKMPRNKYNSASHIYPYFKSIARMINYEKF